MRKNPETTEPDEEPVAPAAGLTSGAVARRIGVSPTTLRSWDRRYGLGPARREDGRHRRWSPRDIAVLEEMCRLTGTGVPPAEAARAAMGTSTGTGLHATGTGTGPAGAAATPKARSGAGGALPLGEVRQECRGLARAAVRLDAPAVDAAIRASLADHGLVTSWEEVLMPALRAVGRKWAAEDERYVEVEHLLSWHVSAALRAAVAPQSAQLQGPPALLACVPGEQHSLPLEALAAGLVERGLPLRMFGAALPVPALEEAVRRTGPAAVVLWSQSRSTASRPLARHVGSLGWGVRGARHHPLVVAAGPGWAGPAIPGAERPHNLLRALGLLEEICVGRGPR